jgi:RND family efflux transporter MFP subunit
MKKKITKLLKFMLGGRKRIIAVMLIILAAGYFFYKKSRQTANQPVIQTTTVQKGTIISSATASGSIISSNIENVTTQASGTVKKVYVSDGQKVIKGQKLAEINLDVQGQQNYESVYSNYISAVNSLYSAQGSYRSTQASLAVVYDQIKGHDTDETLQMKETRTKAEVANDNAYNGVKSAEIRLTVANLDLITSSPIIVAPTSGIIKSVTIAEGMNIGTQETSSGSRANQRIATISSGGLPIATFNVSEIDVSDIKPGQNATITLDAITDKTFTGKVVSVDSVGSTSSNVTTYPVIIQLDTSSDEILPNMAATANIIKKTKSDVLVVPSGAVSYQGGQAYVTVIQNGQQISKNIEVGISSDTQIEVTSGLSEGDIVITSTSSASTSQSQSSNRSFFSGPAGGGERVLIR